MRKSRKRLSGDDGHGERLKGDDGHDERSQTKGAARRLEGSARCRTMSKVELRGNENYRRRTRRRDEQILSRGAEEEDSGQR